jgi:hypothetical protein
MMKLGGEKLTKIDPKMTRYKLSKNCSKIDFYGGGPGGPKWSKIDLGGPGPQI